MNDAVVIGGGLGLAVLLAGAVSLLTGSPAILGVTPVGIAIYLGVGIGLPQYLLSRRDGSSLRLGLAVLAVAAGVILAAVGVALGAPNDAWGIGIVPILFVVVIGVLVGSGVRAFRAGYRGER